MATASEVLCALCEGRHITKCAEVWCPECEEGLCSDCNEFHKISKSTKNHDIITIDSYNSLPSEVSSISQYCTKHERKFMHFCPQHDELCCPICIPSHHSQCVGLMAIEEVAKNSKSSTFLQGIEQSLHDLRHNIEGLILDRTEQLDKIQKQKKKITEEVKKLRVIINNHLDNIEQAVLKDLSSAEETISSKTETALHQLNDRATYVDKLQTNFDYLKSYASDVQIFLGSKIMEENLVKEEKILESFVVDGNANQSDIKFVPVNHVVDFPSVLTTFGSVSSQDSQAKFALLKSKQRQAQILTNVHMPTAPSFDDCSLTLMQQLKVPKGSSGMLLTGCTFCPDGKMVIADCDMNKRLLVFNADGSLDGNIPMSPDKPFDVASIDANTIAVSSFTSNHIHTINLSTKSKENIIIVEKKTAGISYKQGTLIYCERNESIKSKSMDSNISSVLVNQGVDSLTFVATSKDKERIYYTNSSTNTVTCCDTTGKKIWEYKDVNILSDPLGIDTDINDNVYVAARGNNNIVLLSPDGKRSKKLFTKESEIKVPYGLNIQKDQNLLLLSCYRDDARVYKIS